MLYYEISFPLTLIFEYIFEKMLLLMTFIYIYISLKKTFFKINHMCLKEVIVISHKIKKFQVEKIQIILIKVYEWHS